MIIILALLTKCDLMRFGLTCKASMSLVTDSVLWKDTDISQIQWLANEHMWYLNTMARQIVSFKMIGLHLMWKGSFHPMLSRFINCTYLNLSRCRLITRLYFLKEMPALQHFVMHSNGNLDVRHLQRDVPVMPQLKTFHFQANYHFTCDMVYRLCQKMEGLENLDLQHTAYFKPMHVRDILRVCPNLKVFLFSMHHCWSFSTRQDWVKIVCHEFGHIEYASEVLKWVEVIQGTWADDSD